MISILFLHTENRAGTVEQNKLVLVKKEAHNLKGGH